MDITTKNGVILTDEMSDNLAEEWETDTWQGQLGKVVMGHPRISDEKLVTLTFKIPESRIAAIERMAKAAGETRSEFLRDAVDKALIHGTTA